MKKFLITLLAGFSLLSYNAFAHTEIMCFDSPGSSSITSERQIMADAIKVANTKLEELEKEHPDLQVSAPTYPPRFRVCVTVSYSMSKEKNASVQK